MEGPLSKLCFHSATYNIICALLLAVGFLTYSETTKPTIYDNFERVGPASWLGKLFSERVDELVQEGCRKVVRLQANSPSMPLLMQP